MFQAGLEEVGSAPARTCQLVASLAWCQMFGWSGLVKSVWPWLTWFNHLQSSTRAIYVQEDTHLWQFVCPRASPVLASCLGGFPRLGFLGPNVGQSLTRARLRRPSPQPGTRSFQPGVESGSMFFFLQKSGSFRETIKNRIPGNVFPVLEKKDGGVKNGGINP